MAIASALRMYQTAILKEGKDIVTGTALKQALLTAIILLKLASQACRLHPLPPPTFSAHSHLMFEVDIPGKPLISLHLLPVPYRHPFWSLPLSYCQESEWIVDL